MDAKTIKLIIRHLKGIIKVLAKAMEEEKTNG